MKPSDLYVLVITPPGGDIIDLFTIARCSFESSNWLL